MVRDERTLSSVRWAILCVDLRVRAANHGNYMHEIIGLCARHLAQWYPRSGAGESALREPGEEKTMIRDCHWLCGCPAATGGVFSERVSLQARLQFC